MLSETTLGYGRRMMTALLGLDALYRKESADGEGLAVVNLDLDRRYTADSFSTYNAAAACFSTLRAEASSLPEADRRRYYDDLAHSTLAFIKWRNAGIPFTSQISDFLHVPAEPAPAKELEALQLEMGELLTKMGYKGDLRAQCAAWEDQVRIPAGKVPEVLEGLLDQTWKRT
ncbi:MAG: hypothetical protein ABIR28_03095, partial [Vicinamibacteria bacterium]